MNMGGSVTHRYASMCTNFQVKIFCGWWVTGFQKGQVQTVFCDSTFRVCWPANAKYKPYRNLGATLLMLFLNHMSNRKSKMSKLFKATKNVLNRGNAAFD